MRNKLPIALSLAALVVALLGVVPVAQSHGVFHAIFAHRAGAVDGKSAVGAGAPLNRAAGKLVATKARGTDRGKFLKKFIPKVDSASTADNATNADTLDGLDSTALQSKGFHSRNENFVDMPASATTTVRSLGNLPPGSYLIFARGSVNSNMAAADDQIDCALAAGGTSQTIDNYFLNQNLMPGETEETTWMIAHTFASLGTVTLSCTTEAAWSGNMIDPTITAISVPSLPVSVVSRPQRPAPNAG
jgi:hypothetical protein